MAGGVYSGLGRGIQNALDIFLSMDQQNKDRARQEKMDTATLEHQNLANRLAREQAERQAREAKFNERFRTLGQTPSGTVVDESTVAGDKELGLGHFYKPEMSPGAKLHTGISVTPDGSTKSTGTQDFIPPSETGRGEFIGFEDARARTALNKLLADNANKAADRGTRMTIAEMTTEQRDRALQALTAHRQQIAGLQRQALALRAQGNELAAAALDARIQQMNEENRQAEAALGIRGAGNALLNSLMGGDAGLPETPTYTPTPIRPPAPKTNPNDPLGVFSK